MKAGRAALATGLFLLLFALGYLAWMRWLRVDVVFYSTLAVALGGALLAALALFAVPVFAVLSRFEKGQLVVIWLLLGYALAISGPTLIDRSLSFYILEKIDERGAIRLDRFEPVVTQEFMRAGSPVRACPQGVSLTREDHRDVPRREFDHVAAGAGDARRTVQDGVEPDGLTGRHGKAPALSEVG